jgi:hypothetical protein
MDKYRVDIFAKGERHIVSFERFGETAADVAKSVVAQLGAQWSPFVEGTDGKDSVIIFRSAEIEFIKATKV